MTDVAALARRATLKPFETQRRAIKPLDIARAQRKLGIPLPPAYREFLQTIGAASCEEAFGFLPLDPIPGAYPSGRVPIDLLYGLSDNDAFDLLEANSGSYELPGHYVGIGHDAGANPVLLSKSGQIFYWEIGTATLYLAARSFEEFLASFGPV